LLLDQRGVLRLQPQHLLTVPATRAAASIQRRKDTPITAADCAARLTKGNALLLGTLSRRLGLSLTLPNGNHSMKVT
jgi:hypothetical protein